MAGVVTVLSRGRGGLWCTPIVPDDGGCRPLGLVGVADGLTSLTPSSWARWRLMPTTTTAKPQEWAWAGQV
jgi:hypothetical protein